MRDGLQSQIIGSFLLLSWVDNQCSTRHRCHVGIPAADVHVNCTSKGLELACVALHVEFVQRKRLTRLKQNRNGMLKQWSIFDLILVLELLELLLVLQISLNVTSDLGVPYGDVALYAMLDFFYHLLHGPLNKRSCYFRIWNFCLDFGFVHYIHKISHFCELVITGQLTDYQFGQVSINFVHLLVKSNPFATCNMLAQEAWNELLPSFWLHFGVFKNDF